MVSFGFGGSIGLTGSLIGSFGFWTGCFGYSLTSSLGLTGNFLGSYFWGYFISSFLIGSGFFTGYLISSVFLG